MNTDTLTDQVKRAQERVAALQNELNAARAQHGTLTQELAAPVYTGDTGDDLRQAARRLAQQMIEAEYTVKALDAELARQRAELETLKTALATERRTVAQQQIDGQAAELQAPLSEALRIIDAMRATRDAVHQAHGRRYAPSLPVSDTLWHELKRMLQ